MLPPILPALVRAWWTARSFSLISSIPSYFHGRELKMPFSLWSLFIEDRSRVKLKNCGSCGKNFACYDKHCWCEAIQPDPALLQRLREIYKDCLCPDCLR